MNRRIHLRTAITSSAVALALVLGVSTGAHAADFFLQNRTDATVFFALADEDGSCSSGTRDHAWIQVGPHAVSKVQLKTPGRILFGAIAAIVPIVVYVPPLTHRELLRSWFPPIDGSSNGRCSEILWNDTDSNPNAGLLHANWNVGTRCQDGGGVLGIDVRIPEGGTHVNMDLVCFSSSPSTSSGPIEPGPDPV